MGEKLNFFDRRTPEGRLMGRLLLAAQQAVAKGERMPFPLSEEEKRITSRLARFLVNHRGAFEEFHLPLMLALIGRGDLARLVRAIERLEAATGFRINGPIFGPFWGKKEKTRLEALVEKAEEMLGGEDPLRRVELKIKITAQIKIIKSFCEKQRKYWASKATTSTASAPNSPPKNSNK